MNAFRTKLVGSVFAGLAAASFFAPAAAAEPPPSSPTVRLPQLGGLPHLIGYCQAQGALTATPTDLEDAYSWVCIDPRGEHIEMDMDDACRWEYPNHPGAWGKPIDDSKPFSWLCYD